MIDHWCSLPLQVYYIYLLRLVPHFFAGLGKLIADCIYQMEA